MYSVDVKEAIEKLIGYFFEDKLNIMEDGLINISVYSSDIRSLEEIGYLLAVERINNFDCSECKNLKDLRGSPREVYGCFNCGYCHNLESLEGGPSYVKGFFYCGKCNKLNNLKGSPSVVEGDFCCIVCNGLISLEGGPKEVYGDFNCSWCRKLKEVKFDVKKIGKNLCCSECISLEYIDEKIINKVGGKVYVKGCKNIRDINRLKRKFGNKIDRKKFHYEQ